MIPIIIAFLAICFIISGISLARPSQRDRQMSNLRSKALSMKWRVTLEKNKRGQFVTVYRYQIKAKTIKAWHWRAKYKDDFLGVPEPAREWINEAVVGEERIYEIKTFSQGIEIHWKEFGTEASLEKLLKGLIFCLNASNNA